MTVLPGWRRVDGHSRQASVGNEQRIPWSRRVVSEPPTVMRPVELGYTPGPSGDSWTAGNFGSSPVSGDLSGMAPAPTVMKIRGTAIAKPPGGTTQYLRSDGTWADPSAGGSSGISSVAAGDASVTVANGLTAPVIETGTLDQIAALHPPAASVPMNSQKLTGLLFGTGAADSMAYGQRAASPGPEDFGLQWWTSDPEGGATATLTPLVPGIVYLRQFFLRAPRPLSGIQYDIAVAGLGPGGCYAGIYDATGTLQARTADQSSLWTSTGALSAQFTAAFGSAPAGNYYAAFLFTGLTGPALKGSGSPPALIDKGLSGAGLRCAVVPGTATSLPASVSLTAISGSGALPIWAAGT